MIEVAHKKLFIYILLLLLIITALAAGYAFFAKNKITKELTSTTHLLSSLQEEHQSIEDQYESQKATISELEKHNTELSASLDTVNTELSEAQALLQRKAVMDQQPAQTFDPETVFDKVVYLTFDDGPSYNTTKILKILDRYNIKATFFVNHTSYGHENNVYKSIIDAGHTLGNHTYHHLKPADDFEAFKEDLFLMEDYLFEMTGLRTSLIRFPGGSSSSFAKDPVLVDGVAALQGMGYIFFDWNVSNNDSRSSYGRLTSDQLFEHIQRQSPGKSPIVVLMHDRVSNGATVKSLPQIIEYYSSRDYVFLPLHRDAFTASFYKPTRDNSEQK